MAAVAGTRILRKRSLLAILFALIWLPMLEATAITAEGLITIQSHYGPKETMQRLEAAVKAKVLVCSLTSIILRKPNR